MKFTASSEWAESKAQGDELVNSILAVFIVGMCCLFFYLLIDSIWIKAVWMVAVSIGAYLWVKWVHSNKMKSLKGYRVEIGEHYLYTNNMKIDISHGYEIKPSTGDMFEIISHSSGKRLIVPRLMDPYESWVIFYEGAEKPEKPAPQPLIMQRSFAIPIFVFAFLLLFVPMTINLNKNIPIAISIAALSTVPFTWWLYEYRLRYFEKSLDAWNYIHLSILSLKLFMLAATLCVAF